MILPVFDREKFKRLLKERGYSITEFAKQVGMERSHVWHLQSGYRTRIGFETAEKLADGLGVPMDALRKRGGNG